MRFLFFKQQVQRITSCHMKFEKIASQSFINNHGSQYIVSPLPPFNRLFTQ